MSLDDPATKSVLVFMPPDGSECAAQVSLVIQSAEGVQVVPLIPEVPISIGRTSRADISVRDEGLSRRHARFILSGDKIWVEDLGSKNGTRVNGEVVGRAELLPQAEVTLPGVSVTVHIKAYAGGENVGDGSDDRPVIYSANMVRLYETVDMVAKSTIPILILGETGTGKEVIAREIHLRGNRKNKPMCCINCGAIPEQLIESALFGHERGAFTGAERTQSGTFEEADGGTVLLDEIGELSLHAQVTLLRVLETKKVVRIGSSKEIEVDTRVVASTNRDLEQMCRESTFRWDLLYRLNTMTLRVPPLRDRREEIPALVASFLRRACEADRLPLKRFEPAAEKLLREYDWPGNVRELRNIVERAVVVSRGNKVTAQDLPDRLRADSSAPPAQRSSPPFRSSDDETEMSGSLSFKQRVESFQVRLIQQTLVEMDGNQTRAAELLQMPRRTLVHKIATFDIDTTGPAREVPWAADPTTVSSEDAHLDFKSRVARFEAKVLEDALRQAGGRTLDAARRLGLTERAFMGKLRKYRIV